MTGRFGTRNSWTSDLGILDGSCFDRTSASSWTFAGPPGSMLAWIGVLPSNSEKLRLNQPDSAHRGYMRSKRYVSSSWVPCGLPARQHSCQSAWCRRDSAKCWARIASNTVTGRFRRLMPCAEVESLSSCKRYISSPSAIRREPRKPTRSSKSRPLEAIRLRNLSRSLPGSPMMASTTLNEFKTILSKFCLSRSRSATLCLCSNTFVMESPTNA